MRLLAKLLAALPALSMGACAAVGAPGASGERGSAVRVADGGFVNPAEGDEPACETACAPFECGEGTHPAPLPGECCPTMCESDDCSLVECAPLSCPVGTHSSKVTETCCPVCVRDLATVPGDTCERGQEGYASFQEQMIQGLGANLCTEDGNCRMVVIDNKCSHGCGTAVTARVASTLKENLNDYASTHCTACPASGNPCPPIEHVAFCAGGVCSMH